MQGIRKNAGLIGYGVFVVALLAAVMSIPYWPTAATSATGEWGRTVNVDNRGGINGPGVTNYGAPVVISSSQALSSGTSISFTANTPVTIVAGATLYAISGTAQVHFHGPVIAPQGVAWIDESSVSAYFHKPMKIFPDWWKVDGVDDQKEVTAAFSSLPNGGEVELNDPLYSFSYSAVAASNTILTVQPWVTVKTTSAASSGALISAVGVSTFVVRGGGILDGNRSAYSGDTAYAYPLYVANSYNIRSEDIRIKSGARDNFYITGSTNVVVRGGENTDSAENGGFLNNVLRWKVLECDFHHNLNTNHGTGNLIPWTGSSDGYVAGNTFRDTTGPAGSGHGIYAMSPFGLRLGLNNFENLYGWGIEFNTGSSGYAAPVIGNVFDSNGNATDSTGGFWVGGHWSVAAAANVFRNNDSYSIMAYGSPNGNAFSGNLSFDSRGMRFYDSPYIAASGNVIRDEVNRALDPAAYPLWWQDVVTGSPYGAAAGNVLAGFGAKTYLLERENISHAGNYEGYVSGAANWTLNEGTDGIQGERATMTGTYTVNAGYSGTYFLDPNGADRAVNPAGTFIQGSQVTIVNIGSPCALTFAGSGVSRVIGPGQSATYAYSGVTWYRVNGTN
jgi:hypothetical protein